MPSPADPTPQDILDGCERIRAGWTASEWRRRATGATARPRWEAPATKLDREAREIVYHIDLENKPHDPS